MYLVPAGTLHGFGVAAVYLLAPASRWPLLPAAVLGLLAIADLLDRRDLVPAAAQPFIVPFGPWSSICTDLAARLRRR